MSWLTDRFGAAVSESARARARIAARDVSEVVGQMRACGTGR